MVDDSSDPFNSYPVLNKIANRCVPYGIDSILDHDDVPHGPASIYLVWEEEGISTAQIVDGPHARFAASVPFERYKESFEGYRAMWSPTYRIVEYNVEPYDEEDRVWSSRADYTENKETITRDVLQELGFDVDEDEDLKPNMRVILEAGDGVSVSVGPCSDEWAVWNDLVRNPRQGEPDGEAVIGRELTLRVEGVEVPDERRAGDILDRLGEAALFEIDVASGVGLRLRSMRGWHFVSQREDTPAPVPATRLNGEYDKKPMSLYRYGRSAMGSQMPLLAFLAFYQVLEYHFPAYSPSKKVEALREKLREIAGEVKESDVDGVLSAIGTSKRRLFPEEKQQLMSTIARCVNPAELNGFLAGDEERAQFYGSDASLTLCKQTIPVGSTRGDHRNKVAQRIYEIRNRIVHTKSEHNELESPLFPFDPEVAVLEHDLALVRFLAQKTLIASARPIGSSLANPRGQSD